MTLVEEQQVLIPTAANHRSDVFFPTYDRLPIGKVIAASGVHIYTGDGRRYLDAIAGLGVNALGHSDPEIISAIKDQAEKYLHLSNLYEQEPQLLLAEKLAQLSGSERVFFTNSGTEAVEGAIKLARKYFNSDTKYEIAGMANAFHGRTYGALSVMEKEKYRSGFGPFLSGARPGVSFDPNALAGAVSARTAAVIVEAIQGEGGIVEIPKPFVNALHELRDTYGFLIIADEIQSGIARTGKFFAYEHYGLEPDIVVCAKAIGGGLPLGAILSRGEIANAFSAGTHGTTFGGNALACAAGLVVLERIRDSLLDHVARTAALLRRELERLQIKLSHAIKEIRGKGFMLGVELFPDAKQAAAAMLGEHSVIVNVTADKVIRLLPPLIFSEADCQELANALEAAL